MSIADVHRSRRRLLAAAPALLVALATGPAPAAEAPYPDRPLRFIVPVPPGGSVDMLARILGTHLQEALGQPVVVENHPGAGSNIAFALVAKAPPDGYTILIGWDSLAINPSLYASLPFDAARDFAPIAQTVSAAQVLVVRPSLGVSTVAEFLALAKQRGGKLSVGSPGSGSIGHLAAELLKSRAGVEWVHVPYRGGGPAIADLLGDHIDAIFLTMAAVTGYVREGKIRALAVSTAERASALPDVPTLAESGFAGYDVTSWQGLLAPAATPPAVVEKLNRETLRVLQLAAVRERLLDQGFQPVGNSPDAFAAMIRGDIAKYADLVRISGAKVD
jgi:tripartite-type tricarboxylate transporter receptor subunit TctC